MCNAQRPSVARRRRLQCDIPVPPHRRHTRASVYQSQRADVSAAACQRRRPPRRAKCTDGGSRGLDNVSRHARCRVASANGVIDRREIWPLTSAAAAASTGIQGRRRACRGTTGRRGSSRGGAPRDSKRHRGHQRAAAKGSSLAQHASGQDICDMIDKRVECYRSRPHRTCPLRVKLHVGTAEDVGINHKRSCNYQSPSRSVPRVISITRKVPHRHTPRVQLQGAFRIVPSHIYQAPARRRLCGTLSSSLFWPCR